MGFRFVQKSMTLNDLERPERVQSPVKSNLLRTQRSAHVSFTNLLVSLSAELTILVIPMSINNVFGYTSCLHTHMLLKCLVGWL